MKYRIRLSLEEVQEDLKDKHGSPALRNITSPALVEFEKPNSHEAVIMFNVVEKAIKPIIENLTI